MIRKYPITIFAVIIIVVGAAVFVMQQPQVIAPVDNSKDSLIRLQSPQPSPLTLKGEARGYWYFEASFPVRLVDANGNDVPLDPPYVMTANEWMTENFVAFTTTHAFTAPAADTGTLILMKDNPSGLPEHDDELRVPIRFR